MEAEAEVLVVALLLLVEQVVVDKFLALVNQKLNFLIRKQILR